jgi:hypothetical protein
MRLFFSRLRFNGFDWPGRTQSDKPRCENDSILVKRNRKECGFPHALRMIVLTHPIKTPLKMGFVNLHWRWLATPVQLSRAAEREISLGRGTWQVSQDFSSCFEAGRSVARRSLTVQGGVGAQVAP